MLERTCLLRFASALPMTIIALSPWLSVIAKEAGPSDLETAGFVRGRLPGLYRTIAQFFAGHL